MTLLSTIMRDVHHHSHLADITTIRLLMSVTGLVPVPSDALVTPVTFRVRKRCLRGILSDFDSMEDGTRELSGEWVVGHRTWQRLQREWKSSKRTKADMPPMPNDDKSKTKRRERHPPKRKEMVVLYLHGGAYYTSSAATHRLITIPLAKALDARLFSVDYRLAPETRFPGPLHDAVSAYFRMIDDLHISPSNIIVVGDSAGGGLSLALMMYLRDNGYPLPGGAILMSPWVDLTMSCDSWELNAQYDIVPKPLPGDHLNPIACYLGEHMEKYLTHPYASPLFGDLKGLPPMLIQAGDAEVLRDEITLLAHKATLAGVEVRHELYEDAVHVFQSIPFLETSRRAFLSAREFVRDVFPGAQSDSRQALEGQAEEELEQEINNNSARVVKGDGTECKTASEDISAALGVTSTDDESSSSKGADTPEEEPSWVTPWSSPQVSDSEKENIVVTEPQGNAPRTNAKSFPSTRRNSTAAALPPSAPRLTPTSVRRRRSNSQILFPKDPVSSRAPTRQSSREFSHRLFTLSMSSSTAPPPRPSIRRSHTSHPDITSLCQQWANNGPANQTLTYKPENTGLPRRKHSLTLSHSDASSSNDVATSSPCLAQQKTKKYII
ncbi:unnamed protein product [Somion occarium]